MAVRISELHGMIIKSTPIRVRWAGWESDTFRLKDQGWEVYGNEERSYNFDGYRLDIALKSPDQKIMIHGQKMLSHRDLYAIEKGEIRLVELLYHQGFEMQMYRAHDRMFVHEVQRYNWDAMNSLSEIDSLIDIPMSGSEFQINAFPIFKARSTKKEIYLHQADVDQCLDQILKVQFPIQQELKKQQGVSTPVVEAKIYSIAA